MEARVTVTPIPIKLVYRLWGWSFCKSSGQWYKVKSISIRTEVSCACIVQRAKNMIVILYQWEHTISNWAAKQMHYQFHTISNWDAKQMHYQVRTWKQLQVYWMYTVNLRTRHAAYSQAKNWNLPIIRIRNL